ncbi:MAG: clostripain-related cysteine peptidase, partial [Candidatus Parabeggiatoa sp.]|nr:clostripain-related cysteine peptidase [Candidatus Parabeggiatoa sp.]
MKKLITLLILTFANQTFALYDFAAINIIPNSDEVSFCLEYDTQKIDRASKPSRADNLYLAAVSKPGGEVQFVEPTADGFKTTPWPASHDMPVFSQWRTHSEPICLGPFAKAALQDFSLYAGIGNSLEEVMQRNSILKFFDGFPELPLAEKVWTVMVYLVGSDLEAKQNRKGGHHWASQSILEMLAGTTLPNTNSHLVISTGGSTRNGWETVKRALIQNGQQYVLEDLGPQNMSTPQTLSDFVVWAKTHFPAKHYALILWDHGGGTQGYGKDTSPSGEGKMMSLKQLHQAYQTIRQHIANPLDIVVYDAGLMASIEVAEITATVANAMASSVELKPWHGIDYAHLMTNISASPPDNGLAFGSLVKTGYIEHAKNKGTFEQSQITYSVFDLTQLPRLTQTFSVFAEEFNKVLKKKNFLNYQNLSRGMIRAPGYPLKATGRLRSLARVTDKQPIRIDLYNLLQTIGDGFNGFSDSAKALRNSLDQMIVDYASNDKVQKVHPDAGRITLDINITHTAHLSALPEAYTVLNEGLGYYDERRREDGFIPEGNLICPRGLTCAFAQWLELDAEHILGVEAYFGEKKAESSTVYLIDPAFYQYRELS